jgi:uncharacterized protein DUF87
MTGRILDLFFGRAVQRETSRYLDELASAPARASRQQASTLLNHLAHAGAPTMTLGTTGWGQKVKIPISEMVSSHGLITGGSGAGKTYFSLLMLQAIFNQLPGKRSIGLSVVDPKGELFKGALVLLVRRLAALDRDNPKAADELRKRIVIIDFSATDPLTSFNILAHHPDAELAQFSDSRADLLGDLLPGTDELSVNGNAVLTKAIRLLVESNLSIIRLDDVLHDGDFRTQLLRQSKDPVLRGYFNRQFPNVPKQTVAALSRRVEGLFSSEAVRLALSGTTAPDFRALQDDSAVVLINCFGTKLSRNVSKILQALILSDIRNAVFARRCTNHPFLVFLDEAQAFFGAKRLHDHMTDLVTMARSFGSHFVCLTQNVSTAVSDTKLLANIFTNAKWTFSMRGQPSDCTFIKAALPITARRLRPETNPFEPPGTYSINEERALVHDSVASLPDRTGFLWLRSHSPEAIKIETENIEIPHGAELENAIRPLLSNPAFGNRISRAAYEAQLKRNHDVPAESAESNISDVLAGAYTRTRGKSA